MSYTLLRFICLLKAIIAIVIIVLVVGYTLLRFICLLKAGCHSLFFNGWGLHITKIYLFIERFKLFCISHTVINNILKFNNRNILIKKLM